MKKILIVLIAFSFQHYYSFGQGRNNIYLFGYTGPVRGTIDLFSGSPVVTADSNRLIKIHYTHANISDNNGNLLFYTNGVVMMDGNHDTMPNGTGLNPCQYTTNHSNDGLFSPQADLIIPFPDDSSKYYLFHQSLDYLSIYASAQVYYSVIDMNLNGGMGDVIQKNTSFFSDTLWGGGMTACKHANGRDWWLVVPKAFVPTYHVFLISPAGVQYHSSQNIGSRSDFGQAAFSPDGMYYGFREFNKSFHVFDFDRCSGYFSNYRYVAINDSNYAIGFCFSPNSKLAYSSSAHFLYQVNLDSTNLAATLDTVAVWDSTYNPFPPLETSFEFMQIGPNQKIYMNTVWATQTMHYINYPDSIGISCDVQQHSIALPTYNGNSMPNFPNYFLGSVAGSICDSLTDINENIVKNNLALRINPNPAKDIFYVNYQLPNVNADMRIYNTLGNEVMLKKLYWYFGYLQIDCSFLNDGVYFIKITTEDKHTAIGKIAIAR